MYLPQFFKENYAVVKLCIELMTSESFKQYQHEERTLMARRLKSARLRMKDLLYTMTKDTISTPEKIKQLREELSNHHNQPDFLKCRNMGEIVSLNLKTMLGDIKHTQNIHVF